MIHVIKNKNLYEELARVGIEGILLCKGNGYFYLAPDSEEMTQTLAKVERSMIYCNSFRQQSIGDWVKDIQAILGNSI